MNETRSKILIVDDNRVSLKLLELWLKKGDHEVVTAENGKIALERAVEEKPDIIISDIHMPDMDGFQLCREVRLDQRIQFTPFIIYSASYLHKDDRKRAIDVGVDLYIRKPIKRQKFLEIIERILVEFKEKRSKSPIN
jgi:CheY-like chemotaxis protein